MNNHLINTQQAQEIFTKICEKNQWQILVSQYRDDKDYYLESIVLNEKKAKKHEESVYISPEEFAKDINFFDNTQSSNFRIAHLDTFRFLAGFLEMSNLSTVKVLNFFAKNNGGNFKKWESVLELLDHTQDDLPLDAISTVLSQYHARISVKNYSVVAGDLPDLFKILNKCKEQDSHYDFHPALSAFCANHLDQILEKPTIKTFVYSKLKEIVPNHIAFYKEFLQVEKSDKEFFIDTTAQYRTFHLNKDTIFKEYPLNLSSPANSDSYFGLLEGAVVFLNKAKMLKSLNCNHLELFGKQQKNDNFIVSIEANDGFKTEMLKTFFTALMTEAVSLSNSLPNCDASKLKYALKDNYETIFNHAKLDMELPPKEALSPKPSKL